MGDATLGGGRGTAGCRDTLNSAPGEASAGSSRLLQATGLFCPRSAPIRASAPRLHLVERRPSVLLVRAAGAVAAADAAVRCAAAEGARAWAGAADPGLRAQRGAAASGALGTGLGDSSGGRQNGVTAERSRLTGESAGRGVSASRAESARGRNTVLKGLRDPAGKPPELMRGVQNTQQPAW